MRIRSNRLGTARSVRPRERRLYTPVSATPQVNGHVTGIVDRDDLFARDAHAFGAVRAGPGGAGARVLGTFERACAGGATTRPGPRGYDVAWTPSGPGAADPTARGRCALIVGDRTAARRAHRGRRPECRTGALRRVRGRRRTAVVLVCALGRAGERRGDDLDQRTAGHQGLREARYRRAERPQSVDRGGRSDPPGASHTSRDSEGDMIWRREEAETEAEIQARPAEETGGRRMAEQQSGEVTIIGKGAKLEGTVVSVASTETSRRRRSWSRRAASSRGRASWISKPSNWVSNPANSPRAARTSPKPSAPRSNTCSTSGRSARTRSGSAPASPGATWAMPSTSSSPRTSDVVR